MATNKEIDTGTEAKIKEAARKVFQKKGLVAARTRDIAEEAGVNLALVNYYFRSKEKLFQAIMQETFVDFQKNITSVINDESTSVEQKLNTIARNYIDFMDEDPDAALFLISEMKYKTENITSHLSPNRELKNTFFFKQYAEAYNEGLITEANPFQLLHNIMSLIVFPYIASPLLKNTGLFSEKEHKSFLDERRKRIEFWIKALMRS